MDANTLQSYRTLSPVPRKQFHPPQTVRAVATRTASGSKIIATSSNSKNVYRDNWFHRLAINHLSHCLRAVTGLGSGKNGYDGLVETTTAVYRNFDSAQQQKIVLQALEKAIPRPILLLMRIVLPQTTFVRECCAAFTTIFLTWLVGPCEVREGDFMERKEKNTVHVVKCRFLEETNCVGMCTNLCKLPTQTFIKKSMGMHVNMVPNFDDMSCEMIFGQVPPSSTEDPALNQPCYKLCNLKRKHHQNYCSNE
ncbi:hypothetical protein DM860_012300 [Cuscuta australis]|uniref:Beta-carotene isomerase D27-like C-terminal domain-containing protein n=1 Tax=Cuscuta australis TaxID=267555 RepID=A0A328DPT4_9ASTE|nr:hypothetical protein DM860_012300 [Cuscuta australis]